MMKNVSKSALVLVLGLALITTAQAQDRSEDFNSAKLHLANHKLQSAIPILEKLWKSDPQNANLNYLLGLCYVKEDHNIPESVKLLETASNIYTTDYQSGSNKERRAPEYVYYYLTIAYAKDGQCEKALGALNKFYQVYTYNDEYYLVDGQKWVRECNLGKVEEDPVPEVAEEIMEEAAEEEPVAVLTNEPKVQEEEVIADSARVEEVDVASTPQDSLKLEEEKAGQEIMAEIKERKEPKIKERLIPFNDWSNLRTREINYTTLSSQYGVQVAALIDLKPTREFEDLKNVEVYVDENGVFRYVIGRFPYRGQAESLKEKIIELGYKDAFIVDINRPDYSEEVLGLGTSNIDWHIDGKVDYRVQIGAFAALVPSAVAMKYLEVEGIKEYEQNGLTILTVPGFDSYDKAVIYRESLKEKGIDDAFVVAFNRGLKIPLKEAKEYTEQAKREELSEPIKKRKKADF
ncbi:MAG: hypothetical protein Salg2KO_15860 [Salibacteraceae bacterium]